VTTTPIAATVAARPRGSRTFSGQPLRLKVYMVAMVVAAVGASALAVTHPPDPPWLFLALLVLASATATVKVSIPLAIGGSSLSISYIVTFVGLLELGPYAAVPIGFASAWSQCTLKMRERNPWHQTLFSVAAVGLTAMLSGLTYHLASASSPLVVAQAGGAMLAATVYFLANSLFVATAIALGSGQRTLAVWRNNFLWSSPTYYMGGLVAMLCVQVTDRGGLLWALTLAVPAFIIYRSFRAYTERITEEQRQVKEMSDLQLAVIESLALAIEAKDLTSHEHLHRMQTYAEGLARAAGMSEPEVRGVRTAALLHDIGNLAVPEHILAKTGPLTHAEFERVKMHPRVGAEILRPVPFPYPVSSLVLAHHERWDGRGYPNGLKGDDIPLGARILAVIDCFTAMLAERPYRPSRTYAEAILTLRENGGGALDPTLVERFVEELPRLEQQLHGDATKVDAPPAAEAFHRREADSALTRIAVAHQEEHLLHEVAQTLSATLKVSDVVALVSSRLINLMPFNTAALFLYDEESELYLCQHAAGEHAAAIRTISASTTEGLERAAATVPSGRGTRLQSVLVAPLHMNLRAFGALAFYHSESGVYTADHRRLMMQVAAQAAPVVANSVIFERTQEQSLTDSLTGLPNRRGMEQHFAQEMARAERHHQPLSVLLLDMDRFKEINDSFGHQAGDRALRDVAQTLRTALREYDICARFAGDEFVMILGDCDLAQAERRRNEIQVAVSAIPFEPEPGRRVTLNISAGAASYPGDGLDAETLIAIADRRMYRDKAARKNSVGATAEAPLW
jgi:diguanylate cyclase (GGDEF)-like protein/putative nucleotidyltransferase with HDIG domain